MSRRFNQVSRTHRALGLLAALGFGTVAWAAGKPIADAAAAQYRADRAACLAGQSNQDRATCLQEAGAALAEARRGGLDDGGARYRRNARERCAALPTDERSACVARMKGAGTTSGSVQSGGILRELVVPEAAASAAK